MKSNSSDFYPAAINASVCRPANRLPFRTVILLFLLMCNAAACLKGFGPPLAGRADFRAYYAAGTIVRTGHGAHLYEYEYQRQVQNAVVGARAGALPFLYPPFAALLFVPLSLIPYQHAFFVLLLVNLGLLCVVARMFSPLLPPVRQLGRLLLPAAFACLFAVPIALMQGQISFLLLFIFAGTYLLLRRNLTVAAGLCLSLSLVKFQLAIPVVILFAVWKQWRVVVGFLAGGLGAAFVSLATVGREGAGSYIGSLLAVAHETAANPGDAKVRYGMFPTDMPNLHGLTFALSHGAAWGSVLNLLLCVVVLGWAARQKPSLLLALLSAMLVSYHMQPHDLVLLILPLSFVANHVIIKRGPDVIPQLPIPRWAVAVGCSAFLLPLIFPLGAVLLTTSTGYIISITIVVIMLGIARKPFEAALGGNTGNA